MQGRSMTLHIKSTTFKGKSCRLLPMFHTLYERLNEYVPQYSTPIDVLGMIVAIAGSNRSHVLQHLSYSDTYIQLASQTQGFPDSMIRDWMPNFGIMLPAVDPSSSTPRVESRGKREYTEVPIQEADMIESIATNKLFTPPDSLHSLSVNTRLSVKRSSASPSNNPRSGCLSAIPPERPSSAVR